MANYRAVASGNWSSGATWGGGAVPPDAAGHNIYSNNCTVTIDQDVNVALITNASITASFVGGGTSSAAGGSYSVSGTYTILSNSVTAAASPCISVTTTSGLTTSFTGTINAPNATGSTIAFSGLGKLQLNSSNVNGGNSNQIPIIHSGSGNIEINNSNVTGGPSGASNANAVNITNNGSVNCNSCVLNGNTQGHAINNNASGSVVLNSSTINGALGVSGVGINNGSSGVLQINNSAVVASGTVAIQNTGTIIATNCTFTANATTSAITSSGTTRLSGTFVSAVNGQQPINSTRWILNTAPTNSYIQQALDGINSNSFVRFYTADNNLGQANPSDVRNGVSYASGNLTGTLTVPVRGTIANGVTYGPSMPFTATRSGTTATATLAYSYPYQVGDTLTVSGASNSEWNGDYTIASVVSGTSVTFTVPSSISTTAGTGARMQTKGTAVLDASAVASAVWGAATRTLTASLDPTVAQIRAELDTNSIKLANLDTTVSSRLAPSGTLARVTLVDTATTLTNAAAGAPSAADNAAAVWSAAARTITGGTVTTLTNAPTVPSASAIASQVRTELAVELARVDQPISTRATPANIPTSDITAIKAKTDLLNTDRLAQCATTSIVGSLIAQSNS